MGNSIPLYICTVIFILGAHLSALRPGLSMDYKRQKQKKMTKNPSEHGVKCFCHLLQSIAKN